MKIYLTILFSFSILLSQGQNRNSVWCFGDSAGIDFSNLSNPIPISSSIDARGSCVSVCDSTGNLLFYGSTFNRALWLQGGHDDVLTILYDKNGNLMARGDSIIGEQLYQELAIVPMPDSEGLYYPFSIGVTYVQVGLYYSVVDMSLNGGLGKVIAKNIQLTGLYPMGGIVAIKHGNGRDYWIVMKLDGYNNGIANNVIYSYLVSPDGISSPIVDSIGSIIQGNGGEVASSKDGSKMAMCTWRNLLEVFDFDRCSGHLTNPVIIEPENINTPGYLWSISFSPSGNLLYRLTNYVGSNQDIGYLYQYDLTAANIQASKVVIDTFNAPEIPGDLRLAPDDKIYLSTDYGNHFFYLDSVRNYVNENLSVINQPDSLGGACGFQPFSFYLGGKRTYYGLPNNPDYEMGPLIGSGCDSLVGVKSQEFGVRSAELHVFYHPGWQVAFVNAEGLKGKNYSLHVYDLTGREVFKESGKLNGAYYTKDLRCEGFANGMYIVNLRTEKELLSKKFIKL